MAYHLPAIPEDMQRGNPSATASESAPQPQDQSLWGERFREWFESAGFLKK